MYGVIIKGEKIIIRSELQALEFETLKQLSKITFIANYYNYVTSSYTSASNILKDVQTKYPKHTIITVHWTLFYEICVTGVSPLNELTMINYEETKRLDN